MSRPLDVSVQRERRRLGILTVSLALILFCVKFYAFWVTRSQAIFSDAMENIVNIVSGGLALWALTWSAQPRDQDHPYGHGKIEFFAGVWEGAAITIAGILIVWEAVQSWIAGQAFHNLTKGLLWVALAGALNGTVGAWLLIRGRALHSVVLQSNGKHLLSDTVTSIGVIVGLVLANHLKIWWLDPLIAIGVGTLLAIAGIRTVFIHSNDLLDREDPDTLGKLLELFNRCRFSGIIRIHDTRVLRSGRYHHVDLHCVVPEFWTVDQAHEKTNRFEQDILQHYPIEGEFHFHIDPCERAYCEMCDYEPCPVRKEKFVQQQPFELKELLSPQELRHQEHMTQKPKQE